MGDDESLHGRIRKNDRREVSKENSPRLDKLLTVRNGENSRFFCEVVTNS